MSHGVEMGDGTWLLSCVQSERLGRRSLKVTQAAAAGSLAVMSGSGEVIESVLTVTEGGGLSRDPGANTSWAVRDLERGRWPRCHPTHSGPPHIFLHSPRGLLSPWPRLNAQEEDSVG